MARSTTSRMCPTSWPASRIARTTAQPPATASTHPLSPQRHAMPSAAGVLVCPNSPAAPSAPRCRVPPATIPAPSPVDALTSRMSRASGRSRRSASTITLASLSSSTGASVSSRRYGASGTPSQPCIGGVAAASAYGVRRAGDRQSHAQHRRRRVPRFAQQRLEPLRQIGEQLVGPDADLLVEVGRGQDLAGQVAYRELGPATSDRRREHHARVGVEQQPRRWPTSGRAVVRTFDHQPAGL